MPLDAKDMVPSLWDVLSKPSPTNTWPLGSSSLAWSNLFLGPNGANAFDPTTGNIGFFARTAAEISAGITPTSFVYPELQLERYGGKADGSTDNATPFSQANSVMTSKGGGRVTLFTGTYNTSGSISLAYKGGIQGQGMQATVIQYTGSGTFITLTSAGGSNDIRDVAILGTGKTGIGIQLGDTSFAGLNKMSRLFMTGWSTAIRLGGSLWTTIEDSYIKNNTVGIDFNASWASGHSNTVKIIGNQISFNDHEGVAASNVPVRNQNVLFMGGSIEQNCITDLTRSQLVTGSVEQLTILNVYFEYAAAGTKPNGINLQGASDFGIRECFFNLLNIGITASAASKGVIEGCRFIGSITNDLNLSGGVNVHDIRIEDTNDLSGATNVLAGTNVTLYTAPKAQQTTTEATGTPTLGGSSTLGSQTYSSQVLIWNQIANQVFFRGRVTITAKGAPVGGIIVGGLPVTAKSTSGGEVVCAVECDGITLDAGYTQFVGVIDPNTTNLQIWELGSNVVGKIIPVANLGATANVYFSGNYTT